MKIIVICTGNTCRSQIAEGLLKNKYPDFEIQSAGTHPESVVNPYAVRATAEEGYDISMQYPKLVDDFIEESFDYVLTVCNSAEELCPVFPNAKIESIIHSLTPVGLHMIQMNMLLQFTSKQ